MDILITNSLNETTVIHEESTAVVRQLVELLVAFLESDQKKLEIKIEKGVI